MTTPPETSDDPFAGLSDGDLRGQIAALQAETERRQTEDQHARAQRLRTELDEVRAGTRPARREHILAMTPQETVDLMNQGHLQHLGYGPSRRARRTA